MAQSQKKPLKKLSTPTGSGQAEDQNPQVGPDGLEKPMDATDQVGQNKVVKDENSVVGNITADPDGDEDQEDDEDASDSDEDSTEDPDGTQPKGDGESKAQEGSEDDKRWDGQPAPANALAYKDGEQINVEGILIGGQVHLTKDVYMGRKPTGSKRWQFFLLYAKGNVVAPSKVGVVSPPPQNA